MDLSHLNYLRNINLDEYFGVIKYWVKLNSNLHEISKIYNLIK